MLEGNKVRLIPPKKEFIPTFSKWMNDREVLEFLIMYKPITLEQEEKWYANMIQRENEIFFSIMKKENPISPEKLIGNVSIKIDNKNRVGSLGIFIGEKEEWGKGFGTESLQLILDYGFNTVNLNRIELEVFATNIRAQRCYKKVGFIQEGTRRNAIYLHGNYIDSILMGILKSDWIS